MATVLGVAALTAVAYVFFPAHRSHLALDRAPETLVIPDYYDEVFFQGQGFPVRRTLVREGAHNWGEVHMNVVRHFPEGIAYKNIQETPEQVQAVNARYAPEPRWRYRPERRLGHYKCMATSASVIADWFALERGASLPSYVSLLDGKAYRGLDPKVLDALYYRGAREDPDRFKLSSEGHLDPVSGVRVPYSVAAFASLLQAESETPEPRRVRDASLPVDFAYSFASTGPLRAVTLFEGKVFWKAFCRIYPREESESLRRALDTYGPVLAGIKIRFSTLHGVFRDTRLGDLPIPGASGHGVVIVGWVEKDDRLYFLYRETFGDCDEEHPDCGPAYRIYPVYGFNEAFAFRPLPLSQPAG